MANSCFKKVDTVVNRKKGGLRLGHTPSHHNLQALITVLLRLRAELHARPEEILAACHETLPVGGTQPQRSIGLHHV